MNRPSDSPYESTVETSRPDRPAGCRPFPWSDLPSLDADEVELQNRLLRLLPGLLDGREALESVAARLTELTGAEYDIGLHRCRLHRNPPVPTFGDVFVTRFHLPPDPEVGAFAVDLELVERWIETLPDTEPRQRQVGELDSRDFGLATYVCLTLLEHLKAEYDAPPIVFPTEPPLRDILTDRLTDTDRLIELVFTVRTVGRRYLARLFLTEGLVRNLEAATDNSATETSHHAPLLEGTLGDLRLEFPIRLGTANLRRTEYRRLDRGAVLLLQRHGLRREDGPAEHGEPHAALELASTTSAILPGHMMPGSGEWRFRLDSATPTHAQTMSQSHDTSSDDVDTPGPTATLEAPETTLEVRVGSVTLSLGELGKLSSGQVLTLDRRIGADAELVVDGRVVGRGELVDVEGEIGVRIRHIEQ